MQCYNCDSKRIKYNKQKDSYVCLDCNYEYPKQYFFVSHSHLDIEKVRIVRNIIEETFFYEPILFFLKCLSDEQEINDLLQREIKERIWFVYCKSENAEKSKYVAEERNYIDSLIKKGYNKKILTVELDRYEIWDDECQNYIRRQIAYKIRKTKIMLSSNKNNDLAQLLSELLMDKGYTVFLQCEMSTKFPFAVDNVIKRHSYKDGLFMPVLTESSLSNDYMQREIAFALENNAVILPVVTNKSILDNYPLLSRFNCIIWDRNDVELSANRLIEALDRM